MLRVALQRVFGSVMEGFILPEVFLR